MSGMQERSSPDGGAREKIDEDDHDLLTFGEAGERLRAEIAATAARVAELQRLGDRDALATATARLTALRAAAKRNQVSAQLALGDLLAERAEADAEWHEAAYWYRRAAEKGNTNAAARLAQVKERRQRERRLRAGPAQKHRGTGMKSWHKKREEIK